MQGRKKESPKKRRLRKFLVLCFCFAIIFGLAWVLFPWQFFQPEIRAETFRAVEAQKTFDEVLANYDTIVRPRLEQKCFQCHTNTDQRPFFYHVPLLSLFTQPYVEDQIRGGRSEFEFTHGLPEKRVGGAMEFLLRIRDVVHENTMPPKDYRIGRPWTALTEDEQNLLHQWAESGFEILQKQNIGAESPPPTGREPSGPLSDHIAKGIVAACPLTETSTESSRRECASKLAEIPALLQAMNDPFLWGQQKKAGDFRLDRADTTRFNPRVFRQLYLPLFMFPGDYQIEKADNLTVIRMPYVFRGDLDVGDYPYPFWHSAKKWKGYHQSKALLLVLQDGKLVGGLRSAEQRDTPIKMASRAWDKLWYWKNQDTGQWEPKGVLFENLFSKENPHVSRLDSNYRKLALGLQRFDCMSCHSPDNPTQMKMLELLNYPNQALTARNRLIQVLEQNSMPPGDGIQDEIARRTLLEMAQEFQKTADEAFDFEHEKWQDWMSQPPAANSDQVSR